MKNPLQTSAQFAAYVWYTSQPRNAGKSADEAYRFARLHWERFLPAADAGFGRLLHRLAAERNRPSRPQPRRVRPNAIVSAAG